MEMNMKIYFSCQLKVIKVDSKRMKSFLEKLRKQKEDEFCKNGHMFIDNKCKNCGKSSEVVK